MATWIEVMEQRVGELEQKARGFGERFDAIDLRFDAVDKRFDAIDKRLDAMDQRFDAMDQRFDAMDQRFDAIDRRFDELPTKDNLKAFMEEMSERVKVAAEGYGATLEAIRRDIKRQSTQFARKDRDQDLVLKDHAKRILALEAKRPGG
jgi:chromosome segregation ATPase